MSKRVIGAAILVLSLGLILSACKSGATTTTTPATTTPTTTATTTTTTTPATTPPTTTTPTTPTVDVGAIYAANCAACHGNNRQGVSGLAPALTATSLADMSETQVKDTIAAGRAGTAMSGFEGRLTADQIEALAKYLKTGP